MILAGGFNTASSLIVSLRSALPRTKGRKPSRDRIAKPTLGGLDDHAVGRDLPWESP